MPHCDLDFSGEKDKKPLSGERLLASRRVTKSGCPAPLDRAAARNGHSEEDMAESVPRLWGGAGAIPKLSLSRGSHVPTELSINSNPNPRV